MDFRTPPTPIMLHYPVCSLTFADLKDYKKTLLLISKRNVSADAKPLLETPEFSGPEADCRRFHDNDAAGPLGG